MSVRFSHDTHTHTGKEQAKSPLSQWSGLHLQSSLIRYGAPVSPISTRAVEMGGRPRLSDGSSGAGKMEKIVVQGCVRRKILPNCVLLFRIVIHSGPATRILVRALLLPTPVSSVKRNIAHSKPDNKGLFCIPEKKSPILIQE